MFQEKHAVPEAVNQKVLQAIQGALREEKEPGFRRFVRVIFWTLTCLALFGGLAFISFRSQLNWAWAVAGGFFGLCLLIGFALHFYPQPRLVISGVWSPFILARLLIVASLSTVIQVLICPSFVFLESPLDWNPFEHLTHILMNHGGMELCMLFCGFVFTGISGFLGLGSVARVIKGARLRNGVIGLFLVLMAQAPVLWIQIASEDLRPFASFWALGLVLGGLAAWVGVFWLGKLKNQPPQPESTA